MAYKLLLAESENFMRKYIKGTLEREGYTVHAVKTGEECLAQINARDYQINLVNVELPDIEGLELIKQVKMLKPTLHSIALVRKKSSIGVEECRRGGFDDYFIQPFKLDVFLRTLDRVVDNIQRLTHILEHESWSR